MTTPDWRSIMPGRKARSRRPAASRLTSSIRCQSSSESTSNPPGLVSVPPTLFTNTSSPHPLLLNAIDDVLDAAGRSEIRLYKESRSQAWGRRRARGGGDRGTAQFKTTYDRFSYTLRATGHENTLAFELIAKNDKRIAVLIHREKV